MDRPRELPAPVPGAGGVLPGVDLNDNAALLDIMTQEEEA
jgi:hypothetical protein